MNTATIVGYVASICSITSFTPQAWKIIKTRDVQSISAAMYVVTVAGFALWTAFGLLKGEWPIIITNATCFLLSGFILIMKWLPDGSREKVADRLDPNS